MARGVLVAALVDGAEIPMEADHSGQRSSVSVSDLEPR